MLIRLYFDMTTSLRIIVLGTGDFALPTFEHLHETGHNVVRLDYPARPAAGAEARIDPEQNQTLGRGAARQGRATRRRECTRQPGFSRRSETRPACHGGVWPDSVGALLSIPHLGGINLHGSILPAYRGAAPVARAIQNNETESGVTVIRMTPQIDAGGIISIARTPIDPEETAGELEERLAQLGAPLIVEAIAALTAGTVTILPQDRSKVTKAPKLRKEDGLIDWSQPASSVHNLVRAMQPWPVAYTTWRPRSTGSTEAIRWIVHKTQVTQGNGEPGEVIEAAGDRLVVAAGEGAVALLTIQLAGRKPFAAAEFRRGQRVQVSDRLGF